VSRSGNIAEAVSLANKLEGGIIACQDKRNILFVTKMRINLKGGRVQLRMRISSVDPTKARYASVLCEATSVAGAHCSADERVELLVDAGC